MRVVHIATTDFGGAAIGMLNLHYALLAEGIDSKVLVAEKTTASDTVFKMQPNYDQFHFSRNRIVRKVQKELRKRGYLLSKREFCDRNISRIPQGHNSSCYTSPYSQYNILENSLVQDADIIHLHWVGNFLDYPSFFENVNKPVVWTIRDENPGLGGFHYCHEKRKLIDYYRDVENHYLSVKRRSLSRFKQLTLVNLSDVMMGFCKDVDYLSGYKSYKIYNSIDSTQYVMIDRGVARQALGIADNRFVVSFVSVTLSDYRKNIDKVFAAITQFDSSCLLLCVGYNDFFKGQSDNIVCYGHIENSQLMSIIYSASDVFVTPSEQESFGKTTVEALMCGTPVVSAATGVAPEILNNTNGVVLVEITDKSILNALTMVQATTYDREKIRQDVFDQFSPNIVAQEYIGVYKNVLNS